MAQTVTFLLVLTFLFLSSQSEEIQLDCKKKEKNLASLDLAKDAISKARDLYPHCQDGEFNATGDASECGKRAKSLGYLETAFILITDAEVNYPTCPIVERYKKPMDCSQVLENGRNESGVYTIWPRNRVSGEDTLDVFCDMETDGGGWTVIQRRGNFSQQEDFYRNWEDYKNGFGDNTRDFWIGNDNIFELTNQASYAVRFDMYDIEERTKFALYRTFEISDEKLSYTLSVSNYSGSAGDCLAYLNGMKFSTKDRRNDRNGGAEPCTESRQSGWWFNTCKFIELIDCNPNGLYQPDQKDDYRSNYWWYWTTAGKGMFFTEAKLKPTDQIDNC